LSFFAKKGINGKMLEEERLEMDRLRNRNLDAESKIRQLELLLESKDKELAKVRSELIFDINCDQLNINSFDLLFAVIQLEDLRLELNKRDQEIMAMAAKMKTLEEQHQDYQRHIVVLKESLCVKEEHYNMLQADVSRLTRSN
jgi:hypothetical protein